MQRDLSRSKEFESFKAWQLANSAAALLLSARTRTSD
jgi:hypothetical protein